jgi:hypothetical protein
LCGLTSVARVRARVQVEVRQIGIGNLIRV